jgi:hypothetical protein
LRIERVEPPRRYSTGLHGDVEIGVCAEIHLDPGEQVTFRAPAASHDVVRTDWGFYAAASLNARLPSEGLHPALVRASTGKIFLLLVANGSESSFEQYLAREALTLLCWLDDERALAAIEQAAVEL